MVPGRVVLLKQMLTQRAASHRDALRRIIPPLRQQLRRATPRPPSNGRRSPGATCWGASRTAWTPRLPILAARLFDVAHLAAAFGLFDRQLELAGLFAHPTIRRQADWIDARLAGRAARPAHHRRRSSRWLRARAGRAFTCCLPTTGRSRTRARVRSGAGDGRRRRRGAAAGGRQFRRRVVRGACAPMGRCIAEHANGRPSCSWDRVAAASSGSKWPDTCTRLELR